MNNLRSLAFCLSMGLSSWANAQAKSDTGLPPALKTDATASLRDALKNTADDLALALANNPDRAVQYGQIEREFVRQMEGAMTTPLKSGALNGLVTASVETSRTDKQTTAAFASSGSTNVVDKNGIVDLLGLAIEHGAITQDVTGNTLTLSSSPYALIAWAKGDTAGTYSQYGNTYGRLGVSASFNLTDTTNPLTNVTRKQLNEWTATLRLFGDHSGRSPGAMSAFHKHLDKPLTDMAQAQAKAIAQAFEDDKGFTQRITKEAQTQIESFRSENLSASAQSKQEGISKILLDVFFAHLSELNMPTKQQLGNVIEAFDQAARDYAVNSSDFEQALKELMQRPTLNLVYNQQHPTTSPSYSVVKLVFAEQATLLQLTANVEGSFYHHPDPTKNQETFRGIDAALDLLNKLGKSPFIRDSADKSTVTLSFSGRYERLQENRGVAGKKADIAVAGLKLEIPIAAGISFPISATYANATELIKEAHVQGNFGFTFDLDKLSALLRK